MNLDLPGPGTIFVFSNVYYPRRRRIMPAAGDVLVFLNRARSSSFYPDVPGVEKLLFRRKDEPENFGPELPGFRNYTVLWGIGRDAVDNMSASYVWNKSDGTRSRSMTTGYMVVQYLATLPTPKRIILVNFGKVRHSTFRSPDHNWDFECKELGRFAHLSLEA